MDPNLQQFKPTPYPTSPYIQNRMELGVISPLMRQLPGMGIPRGSMGPGVSAVPPLTPQPFTPEPEQYAPQGPANEGDFYGQALRAVLPPAPATTPLDRAMMPPAQPPTDTAVPVAGKSDEGIDWKSALARALVGFSHGFSATPSQSAYSPYAGGIAGGLMGTAQSVEDAQVARNAADAPYQSAAAMGMMETAKLKADEAFKKRQDVRDLASGLALQDAKPPTSPTYDAATAAMVMQPGGTSEQRATLAAQLGQAFPDGVPAAAAHQMGAELAPRGGIMALSPEQQQQLVTAMKEGRLAPSQITSRGPKAAVLAAALQDHTFSAITPDANIAAARAGAVMNASGAPQRSARMANTVQMLMPGLQQASDNFHRTSVRLLNVPVAAFNEQSGPEAMTLKQYLTDTKFKMAAALMNGGVPTDQAEQMLAKAFPDSITPAQVPVAIQTINAIMETQKMGAMTPVGDSGMGNGGAGSGSHVHVGKYKVRVK